MNKLQIKIFVIFWLSWVVYADDTRNTTGFWQEMHTEIPINTGIQRTGEQIYKYKCYECHDRNTQGAPMPGDQYDWSSRYQKGLDVLIKHAMNGFNQGLMPERGGCRNCSDQELINAILFMLKNSGVKVTPMTLKSEKK